MKVTMSCAQCGQELHEQKQMSAELSNDGDELRFECENGHVFETHLITPQYVILFDHAIEAYKQGNFYESYVSAYAAVEKFRTTAIDAYLWENKNIDSTIKPIRLSKLLKYSERTAGAFTLIFLLQFGEENLNLLKQLDACVEDRNHIMHGTFIPSAKMCRKLITALYHLAIFVQSSWHNDRDCIIFEYQRKLSERGMFANLPPIPKTQTNSVHASFMTDMIYILNRPTERKLEDLLKTDFNAIEAML